MLRDTAIVVAAVLAGVVANVNKVCCTRSPGQESINMFVSMFNEVGRGAEDLVTAGAGIIAM